MTPSPIYGRFVIYVQSLQLAKEVRLLRCYNSKYLNPDTLVELHIFNDASETP